MAKLNRDLVVEEALDLLDEVGLDAVTTRRLAQRLGVEQPSLYWHFHGKAALLGAMAEAAMRPLASEPLPEPGDDWRAWFIDNSRSFRRALLTRRDGARLHAGSLPGDGSRERLERKLGFLVDSGVPERAAQMGMLTASRFTVGSALEEQDDDGRGVAALQTAGMDHASAFDAGLSLIAAGMLPPSDG